MNDEYFLMPSDIRIVKESNMDTGSVKLSKDLEFRYLNILTKNKEEKLEVFSNIDLKNLEKIKNKLSQFTNLKERIVNIYSQPYFSKRLPKKSPLIMGVVNLTKDSFYDGGKYYDEDKAVAQAYKLLEEGAHILDLGAESTRPGAHEIAADIEISKIVPLAKKLSKENILLSCDTRNSSTMKAVLDAGVKIINDVSGLSHDKNSINILKQYNCLYVLTHSRGTPKNMQDNPYYNNAICDIYKFFKDKLNYFENQNFPCSNIILDPGIGFGKNDVHNFNILKYLGFFLDLGLPILIGLSRKSLIGRFINDTPENSLSCSIVLAIDAYMKGANIIRVHDVKETLDAINILKHTNF